jgi:hypothetical protein
VRLADEPGEFRFPFAIVAAPGDAAAAGGTSRVADVVMAATVQCYPPPAGSPAQALLDAGEVEEVLWAAFRAGRSPGGHALRVPLWDFEGVPLDATSGLRWPHDYMRVLDLSIGQLPDPEDARRVRAYAEVRLGWRRGTRAWVEERLVEEVRVEEVLAEAVAAEAVVEDVVVEPVP